MNSTITQLDAVESALLTGYTLNVNHNRKRAQLYRAGDGQARTVEYGLVVATLPRLRSQYGNVISETGTPDGDIAADISRAVVQASRGKPSVPEASPTPANGRPPSDAPPSDAPPSEEPPSDAEATESINDSESIRSMPGRIPGPSTVLDQAWYTARELAALTGLPSKRFSQLFRWVESRAERPNKEYRTGQALLKRLTAMGIKARLADRYKGVEGKASPRPAGKPAPKKAAKKADGSISNAPAKKTTSADADTAAIPPSIDGRSGYSISRESLKKPALGTASPPVDDGEGAESIHDSETTAPAETVADHLIAGVIEQLDTAFIEERMSRAQAYAGLLCDLLLNDDAAPMSHVYLIQDVHAAVTAVMDRLRPGIRIAGGIDAADSGVDALVSAA